MASVSDRDGARVRALQNLVIDLGRGAFEDEHPSLKLTPVVALICAYQEADNIGEVLAGVPTEALGLSVTPVVVVDGGDDGTDVVARQSGAVTFVLPVNLGHGVALRAGYDLCVSAGAQYVVTLDADGQNDPAELETLLAPLVDDAADFVVGSRRLGVDMTDDRYRKAGVVVFAGLINLLTGSHLTDSSSGYRALRATMLSDILGRLEQDQYQTSELLITAIKRGWRVTERPTVWHERASGQSKKGANFLYGVRYATVVLTTWRRER
jgi:glycosyltransferase involved in cell wall biosynthesis